jgi:hypothetical protein
MSMFKNIITNMYLLMGMDMDVDRHTDTERDED